MSEGQEGVSWIRVTPEGPWPGMRDISDKTSSLVLIYAPSWGVDWAVLEYRLDPSILNRLGAVEEGLLANKALIPSGELEWYNGYRASPADLKPFEWRTLSRGGRERRFTLQEVSWYMPIPRIPAERV